LRKSDTEILASLERMRGLSAQRRLSEIVTKELLLRKDIELLNQHRRMSHGSNMDLQPLRASGSLVHWQAWVDKTQGELTLELAQLLAKKHSLVEQCRINTGRTEALSQISKSQKIESNKDQRKKSLANLLGEVARTSH